MKQNIHSLTLLGAAALAALALTACGPKDDNRTAGQKLDGAIATAEQKTDAAKAEMKKDAAEAKVAIKDAAQDAKVASSQTTDKVADAMADAAITTKIKAELARDPRLSAMQINVDTTQGRVELKGKAPDAASRDRATVLATSVRGVMSVDNQLRVDTSS